MSTSGAAKLGTQAFVGLFIAAFVALLLIPEAEPDPQSLEKLSCRAESVALHQALNARYGTAEDAPSFVPEFEDRFRELGRIERSLNQSQPGRFAAEFRQFMVSAEARRDAAVAASPDNYETSAWSEVQRCHEAIIAQRDPQ